MRELAETGDSFFLGLGFWKPHISFTFPERFLDYYDKVQFPSGPHAPVGMPPVAWNFYGNWGDYSDTSDFEGVGRINFTFPDGYTLDLRRAYYAAISHVDQELGRVMDELDSLGLKNSTVVSFLGKRMQDGQH